MARSAPWRRTCSDLVFWRQTEALNATIYILRETGPTGFLLKEEGVTKPCKAFLGDPHSCTCSQFMKDRDLCKHICWLLLKKFRVPQTNQMSWQGGLVEREINEILRGLNQQQRKKVSTAVSRWRRPLSNDSDAREVIPQRDIAEDDVCPICQDELLEKRLPVTYCKFGCGNSIHIKCMKIWAEHQKSQGETNVKCPFCREDFGPFEMLKYENRNAEGVTQGGRMDRHIGTTCQSCRVFPIEGKCYRCSSCTDYHLCQACFNTPLHTQHAFQYRHKRNQRWRPAARAYGAVLPQAVMDDLVNRDISDTDYDLLMQLDSNAQAVGSDIPDEVIQSFPLEKVRENGPLLQPGLQCRVCLRAYQVGQLVRRLPRCKHKFHRDCIDNWLLHSRPTCPIDGQAVWDPISAQMEEEGGQARNRPPKKQTTSNGSVQHANTVNLQIPGMGLILRTQEPSQPSQANPRTQPQVRGRPPLRRQNDRSDREAARVLGALQTNFALSGTSVNGAGYESDNDHGTANVQNGPLPGGRLLDRANVRRAALSQQLSHLQNEGHHRPSHEMTGLVATQIEQENVDPLDQVAAANQELNEFEQTSPRHENHRSNILQERRPNHGSLFGQPVPNRPDITENLLSNMERLSPYREMPNVFSDAALAQKMTLESARTNESSASAENRQTGGQGSRQLPPQYMPPEQRLFATNGSSQTQATHSDSQIMFNPAQNNVSAARGGNSHITANKGRQQPSISSAPASIEGGGLLYSERGRRAERGWSQNNSVTRNRSSSRDRSSERGRLQTGPIPKEGENLLQRLTIFSDLYLGNSPNSHPPTSGIVTTATGLPPRPQRRQYGNQAAARLRRFENERRKNNFQLEGNSFKDDITLRDLLG